MNAEVGARGVFILVGRYEYAGVSYCKSRIRFRLEFVLNVSFGVCGVDAFTDEFVLTLKHI